MRQRPPNHKVGLRDHAPFSPSKQATPQSHHPDVLQEGSSEATAALKQQQSQPQANVSLMPDRSPAFRAVGSPSPSPSDDVSITTPTPAPAVVDNTSPSSCRPFCSQLDAASFKAGVAETLHEMYHYLKDEVGNEEMAECFMCASDQPPITRESLAELNISRIINNPKLRYDVNFDRDLHFRPNLDGSKGRLKLKAADEFWTGMHGEFLLSALAHSELRAPTRGKPAEHWTRMLELTPKRLPGVLQAIRSILKTLVPDRDQPLILDRLDVPLLMQEIRAGICDLPGLADWFGTVLKKHCAPMRDTLVDKMCRIIADGAAAGDVARLVDGLRQLLAILEAMKLDVANHQIRHMRPLLVEDSVAFQRRYHQLHVATGKVDVFTSRLWFERERRAISSSTSPSVSSSPLTPTSPSASPFISASAPASTPVSTSASPAPQPLDVFCSAFLRGLVSHDSIHSYPHTFYLDHDRLRSFRAEFRDMIFQEICATALCETVEQPQLSSTLAKAVAQLRATIPALVGRPGRFADNVDSIAAEIMRSVMRLEGREGQVDHCLLSLIERRLRSDLRTDSRAYDVVAADILARALPKLQESVAANISLSALSLQDALVPARSPQLPQPLLGMGAVLQPPPMPDSNQPPKHSDLIRRMTHVIALHWHVWADAAYLIPLPIGAVEYGAPSSLRSVDFDRHMPATPQISVSTAVYSPGTKFLPVKINTVDVSSMSLPTPSPSPTSESSPSPGPSSSLDTHMQLAVQEEMPLSPDEHMPDADEVESTDDDDDDDDATVVAAMDTSDSAPAGDQGPEAIARDCPHGCGWHSDV